MALVCTPEEVRAFRALGAAEQGLDPGDQPVPLAGHRIHGVRDLVDDHVDLARHALHGGVGGGGGLAHVGDDDRHVVAHHPVDPVHGAADLGDGGAGLEGRRGARD